ncbi:hypothetical protein [Fibrella forsythiae]|nr:hypothetical protein [Fibrella forsythiae]
MKLISSALILVTALLSVKHGWGGISGNVSPEEAKMMADLQISRPILLVISIASLAVGGLVLFPQTFFVGNLLNAIIILLIMAYSLRVGNLKIALTEIPFLLMPLLLIWLGHPFRK